MPKRLYIRAQSDYGEQGQVVPVNTNNPVVIELALGKFEIVINIKGFDGSEHHVANSCYNQGDASFLDGTTRPKTALKEIRSPELLEFEVYFTPDHDINLNDLIFGNDCEQPVRDYIPAAILTTGLKLFNWFINKTVVGDFTVDKPFIYGLAINLFTYINVNAKGLLPLPKKDKNGYYENLITNPGANSSIPQSLKKRISYFLKENNCKSFVFRKGIRYELQFESDLIKMADSYYAVCLPTLGLKTFDINILQYANDKLNNFNWVIKEGGHRGMGIGNAGLVVNFALVDEPEHPNKTKISKDASTNTTNTKESTPTTMSLDPLKKLDKEFGTDDVE